MELDAIVAVELRGKDVVQTVSGYPVVVEQESQRRAGGKGLRVIELSVDAVAAQGGDTVAHGVGKGLGVVFVPTGDADGWVIGGDGRAAAEGRLDETAGTSTRTARATAGATRTAPGAGTEVRAAAAGGVPNDTGVDAAEDAACLSAENIGLGDGNVVASDGEVEIVFERELDSILEGQVKYPLRDEVVDVR